MRPTSQGSFPNKISQEYISTERGTPSRIHASSASFLRSARSSGALTISIALCLGYRFERTAQHDKALCLQTVHERGVVIPTFLLSHRTLAVPSGSLLVDNNKVAHVFYLFLGPVLRHEIAFAGERWRGYGFFISRLIHQANPIATGMPMMIKPQTRIVTMEPTT